MRDVGRTAGDLPLRLDAAEIVNRLFIEGVLIVLLYRIPFAHPCGKVPVREAVSGGGEPVRFSIHAYALCMQRMIADQVGASIAGVIASLPLQVDSIVTHLISSSNAYH